MELIIKLDEVQLMTMAQMVEEMKQLHKQMKLMRKEMQPEAVE